MTGLDQDLGMTQVAAVHLAVARHAGTAENMHGICCAGSHEATVKDDVLVVQVAAMQMGNKPPELSELIAELGRAYDPERLAAVLQDRWFEVNTRAARVAVSLGSFAARVAKVSCNCTVIPTWLDSLGVP